MIVYGIAAAALLLAVVTVLLLSRLRIRRARRDAADARQEANHAREEANRARDEVVRAQEEVARARDQASQDLARVRDEAVRAGERARDDAGRAQDEVAAQARAYAADLAAAADRFADETVAPVLTRLREGASTDTALASVPRPEIGAYERILRMVAAEAGRSENRRAAAMAACANAAGRMQAMTTATLADLREMEHRHADEDVLGDLLLLDHRTAQAGRLADSIAVLSGARSGRRWARPIPMESILRGAMGRIAGYQRVRVRSVADIAVAGTRGRGRHARTLRVARQRVHFFPAHHRSSRLRGRGDGRRGGHHRRQWPGDESETALRRAEQAVSGEVGDLSMLSGSRLGLAVVGRLARKHGLKVSFRPSAIGGTGVVVMIPHELITRIRTDGPISLPTQTRAALTSGPSESEPVGDTATGLPRRRRGRTLAATYPDDAPPREPRAGVIGTQPGAGRRPFRRLPAGRHRAGQPAGHGG
ncbi:ATP-binding protein [Fodinicola feengrottensis]|uniref:ATP-binding protein n=1 Tax=Fodinicola feengrottensis TaxID=435914 RepID=UPI0024415157|nr:ATP-binding protein [Fodinicola feengrottensis]